MKRPRRSSGAFTITEMLVILGLLGVAGLLASRLFTASMRVISAAPAAQDQQASLERMTHALREDVWSSQKMAVVDNNSIELDQVRWRFADGAAVRTAGDGERRWPIRRPIEARVEGASLVLVIQGSASDQMRFVSQGRLNPPEAER